MMSALPRRIAFAGRDILTSHFSESFKPGDTVVETTTHHPDLAETPFKVSTVSVKLKTIQRIDPHGNQPDSFGYSVPEDATYDFTDKVTFTTGGTVLVGQYVNPTKPHTKLVQFSKRDVDGVPLKDSHSSSIKEKSHRLSVDYMSIPDALSNLSALVGTLAGTVEAQGQRLDTFGDVFKLLGKGMGNALEAPGMPNALARLFQQPIE